jgi:hypothetical protein
VAHGLSCEAHGDLRIADDQRGNGHWTADYMFGKTDKKPGRRVVNNTTSVFTFRGDGRIATHHDRCDAKEWARQAYPFPWSFFAGFEPPRRFFAARKLGKFLEPHR